MKYFSRYNFTFLLITYLFLSGNIYGQAFLEGSWKGKYTYGIQNEFGYPFEIFLRIDGRKITGRSYLVTRIKGKWKWILAGIFFRIFPLLLRKQILLNHRKLQKIRSSENTNFGLKGIFGQKIWRVTGKKLLIIILIEQEKWGEFY